MTQTALYRHFDAAGRLLYVGISLSAIARLAQHSDKPWFDQIASVKVEYFPSRDEAEMAERAAIRTEQPLHNRAHVATAGEDVRAIISQWPTRKDFADDAGVPLDRVHKWAQNNAIPAWHQSRVLAACEKAGVAVTAEQLIEMHAAPEVAS